MGVLHALSAPLFLTRPCSASECEASVHRYARLCEVRAAWAWERRLTHRLVSVQPPNPSLPLLSSAHSGPCAIDSHHLHARHFPIMRRTLLLLALVAAMICVTVHAMPTARHHRSAYHSQPPTQVQSRSNGLAVDMQAQAANATYFSVCVSPKPVAAPAVAPLPSPLPLPAVDAAVSAMQLQLVEGLRTDCVSGCVHTIAALSRHAPSFRCCSLVDFAIVLRCCLCDAI